MSTSTGGKTLLQAVYFVSELVGVKVMLKGKKVGKFADVAIRDGDVAAEVTHVYVSRRFGNPSLLIPWEKVVSLSDKEVVVDIESLKKYEGEPAPGIVLLQDHVLDKKILDMEGHEVDVVYDVKLEMINNKLYVSDVDTGRYGLLRRSGLKWLADLFYKRDKRSESDYISWSYIQPLPKEMGSFKGDLKLKVIKDKLSEMHPVDLADILENLDEEQRTAIFSQLSTEQASDALEEIEPGVQRAILASLSDDRIAQLVNEMTPGQAADVLAVLPSAQMRGILKLVNGENAAKIQDILEKHEEKILDYATTNFMKFSPDLTVRQAHEQYQKAAIISDVVMYLYIVGPGDKILGVVDIRELLKANDSDKLKDIMSEVVASLSPTSTLRQASAMFARYGFRAIPVVDDNRKILGVVSYRDMMTLKHRFLE